MTKVGPSKRSAQVPTTKALVGGSTYSRAEALSDGCARESQTCKLAGQSQIGRGSTVARAKLPHAQSYSSWAKPSHSRAQNNRAPSPGLHRVTYT